LAGKEAAISAAAHSVFKLVLNIRDPGSNPQPDRKRLLRRVTNKKASLRQRGLLLLAA
jgi:hypothetical protein